jgi:hypothetical protein
MSEWMRKLHWKKIFTSGIWYLVISFVTQQVFAALTMQYYRDPAYFATWSKLMMPNAGPPSLQFFVVSLLFTYTAGCTLAAVFDFTHQLFGKKFWSQVIGFTDIVVGLSIVLGYLPMILLFNLPIILILWWVVATFVATLLSSVAFAKTIK